MNSFMKQKADRSNLAVTWLDLANACASIPHVLIKYTLSKYCVPEKIQSHTDKYNSFLYVLSSARKRDWKDFGYQTEKNKFY